MAKGLRRGSWALLVVLLFSLVWLYHKRMDDSHFLRLAKIQEAEGKQAQRIVLIESGGVHDEVAASFFDTFGRQKMPLQISAFFKVERFGIGDIYRRIRTMHAAPQYLPVHDFTPANLKRIDPDLVVALSCHNDLVRHMVSFIHLFQQSSAILYCINHNPDYWWNTESATRQAIEPWIKAERFRFISLSPHVASSLRKTVVPYMMREIKQKPKQSTLIPVFEYDGQDRNTATNTTTPLMLTVQGNFESSRRSYDTLLKRYQEVFQPVRDREKAPLLNIVGSGIRVDIPLALQDTVLLRRNAAYPEFYQIMSSSDAILTAFKNDIYYRKKASSTVPAAIIAGVPLIANREILRSYTYLDRASVYLGEGDEMLIAKSIQAMSPLGRSCKSSAMRKLRKKLVNENAHNMAHWISEDLADSTKTSRGTGSR